MGSFLIKHQDQARRRSRLIKFCTEIKRAVFNLCLDHNVPIANLDFFIEELYMVLEHSDREYRTETLLEMLLDEGFVKASFDKYADKA